MTRTRSKLKTVEVTVIGGLVHHVEIPHGVTVVVRDYDVEGCDPASLQQDDTGAEFIEAIWNHEE